jgi:hypothetical protein
LYTANTAKRSMPRVYSRHVKAQYDVVHSQHGKAQYAACVQPTRQSAVCRVCTANTAKRNMPRMYSQNGKAMPLMPLDEDIMRKNFSSSLHPNPQHWVAVSLFYFKGIN